ncbi:MAG TPA: methyltransferase domain-containing protein [bacterium]|nr:methyltransferase domain-containing protein [bacterium]
MPLCASPHVRFLEQYRALRDTLFERRILEETPYFKNAAQSVRLCGSYFGHRTAEGIAAQARSFVRLYDRTAHGDAAEVKFTYRRRHSPPASRPIVRETLTPNTFQVSDGHHRLAIAWALGRREVTVTTAPPRTPTPLQSLVLACAQTRGRRELYQPIETVEFDGAWNVVRRCDDRLTMMLGFLAASGRPLGTVSVLDIACSYGWFVDAFARRGAEAVGVDADLSALKIGRIAYGLRPDQTVHSDLQTFLSTPGRTWDIVLLLSVLHHFVLNPKRGRAEDLLRMADRVTGTCLFVDTGQAHERWWRGALGKWDNDFVGDFIRRHTSFTRIVPLGTDTDYAGPYRQNYGRTLFACLRGS